MGFSLLSNGVAASGADWGLPAAEEVTLITGGEAVLDVEVLGALCDTNGCHQGDSAEGGNGRKTFGHVILGDEYGVVPGECPAVKTVVGEGCSSGCMFVLECAFVGDVAVDCCIVRNWYVLIVAGVDLKARSDGKAFEALEAFEAFEALEFS